MSVALPERSWSPHKVLLVMPDLQIFIISPPDNLIMQRCRIHFSPLREPVRDALFPDYFPALPAALYKPTRTPSIMLFSPFLLSPQSWKLESCNVPFCLALLHSYNNNRKDSPPENTLHRQQSTFLFKREGLSAFLHAHYVILQNNSSWALLTVKGGNEISAEIISFDPILLGFFFSFPFLLFPSCSCTCSLIIIKWRGKKLSRIIPSFFFFLSKDKGDAKTCYIQGIKHVSLLQWNNRKVWKKVFLG